MCLTQYGQLCVFRSLYCEYPHAYYHDLYSNLFDYGFTSSYSNYYNDSDLWYYENFLKTTQPRCDLYSDVRSFYRISTTRNYYGTSYSKYHYLYDNSTACFGTISSPDLVDYMMMENNSLVTYSKDGGLLWTLSSNIDIKNSSSFVTIGYNASVYSSQFS